MSRLYRQSVRAPVRILFALSFALLAIVGCSHDAHPIRIGTVGPYQEPPGAENLRGIQMAVAEANAQGGINGRQLELVIGNDSAIGEIAARIADRFIEDPTIVAVVGHMTSGAMNATAQLYSGHLAAVTSMGTSSQLNSVSPWVFRVIPSDSILGADLARFAASRHWSRMAVLYENDAWGRGLSSAFQAAQRITGGETISADAISVRAATTSTADVGVFLRTYARSRPDGLMIITGNAPAALALLKSAKELDFQLPIILSDALLPHRLAVESESEGAYFPSKFLIEESDSIGNDFRKRFKERYGYESDMYAAFGYDAALVVISAIRAAGTNRERIRAALASNELAGVRGATGNISFANADRKERFGGLVRIEGGEVKTNVQWKNAVTAERILP